MNLLIIGPQGSGKGTQGKKLAELLDLEIVEMGDILRNLADDSSDASKKIRKLLSEGVLLPSDLVNEILGNYLDKLGKRDNLLFDAYPRQAEQWKFLKQWLEENETRIDAAINLELDDEKCIQRLEHRVMSKTTGEIFNNRTNPPPANWDRDDLVMREDDKPESVKRRLELYRSVTIPLIELYRKENLLMTVDASGTIEEVYALILSGLRVRKLLKQ